MTKEKETFWDEFAEADPYFAVSSFEKFYKENLDESLITEFFESGEEYVERIWNEIERSLGRAFKPERALDFGCGLGRLTIPIAKRSGKAVAVDISQKMLDEARANSVRFKAANVEFIKGDDELSALTGKFDFVHSFIVIQHIRPGTGYVMIGRLLDLLEDSGFGALHVTYHHPGSAASVLRYRFYREFPLFYRLRCLLLNKRHEPLIPVYTYDLNRVFKLLQENGCGNVFVRFSDHGHLGALIFFQKGADAGY